MLDGAREEISGASAFTADAAAADVAVGSASPLLPPVSIGLSTALVDEQEPSTDATTGAAFSAASSSIALSAAAAGEQEASADATTGAAFSEARSSRLGVLLRQ